VPYNLVVNVIQTEELPVQIFLDVQGFFSSGCGRLGQINQRLVNNKFEVQMYTARNPLVEQGLVSCTMALAPFRKAIQLNAYGLSAGTYSYDINGMTGTFELSTENKLPDELLPAPDPSVFQEDIIVLPE